MAMIPFHFARFMSPTTGEVIEVNISSWEENPLEMNGGRARAFDGEMLVTENGGKYSARGTVEFDSGDLLFTFEQFIAQDMHPWYRRPDVYKQVLFLPDPSGDKSALRRGNVSMLVWARLGRKTPREDLIYNPLSPSQPILRLGWSCELIVEEV